MGICYMAPEVQTGPLYKPRQHIKKAERGGEGEMYGKSNMETYIAICEIDSQWEFAVWLRKLKQGLCINLEGCVGEGGGREVQKGIYLCLIHVEV